MPDTSNRFDFKKRVAYNSEAKRRFHCHARAQLLKLAEALGLTLGEYDLRSNEGASPSAARSRCMPIGFTYRRANRPLGADTGILFCSCEGRRDYTGGHNNFASLDLLHRPDELAALIRGMFLPKEVRDEHQET